MISFEIRIAATTAPSGVAVFGGVAADVEAALRAAEGVGQLVEARASQVERPVGDRLRVDENFGRLDVGAGAGEEGVERFDTFGADLVDRFAHQVAGEAGVQQQGQDAFLFAAFAVQVADVVNAAGLTVREQGRMFSPSTVQRFEAPGAIRKCTLM